MPKKRIKFGFCVPIFANPGMLFFRTPAYKKLDWHSIKEAVILCEDLNYHSVFVADHLFLGREGAVWECWTLMSAFAAMTKKVEIIPIHLCDTFRNPSLVAKMACTLDHVSNGRISLFYDYGWRKAEFDSYGYDFRKRDSDRLEKMIEGLKIIKGMLGKKRFTFKGRYYSVDNVICEPKPNRKIPIWMGEANNPAMLKAIVKFADVFNSMPASIDGLRSKLSFIRNECKRQKRSYDSLDKSLETQVLICKETGGIKNKLQDMIKMRKINRTADADILKQLKKVNPALESYSNLEKLKKEFIIGTPEEVRERLEEYIEEGISHFMLWFMDFPSIEGIKLFAKEVIPYFC